MNILKDIVHKKLSSYLKEDSIPISKGTFILALSGGVDSVVLLHSLHQLGLNFYTIHFNHNYHEESNSTALYVKNEAEKLNSNRHFTISLKFKPSQNFESAARKHRYFHLTNLARRLHCNYILTAHHLDDQIETLYMRKVQRAHWSNSIGIREKLADIRRPLLCITKREIVKFATENQIKWIEDPTNADNSFLRNRVRNIELPILKCEQIEYEHHLLHNQKRNFNRLEVILKKIKSTNFEYKKHSFGISINHNSYFNFGFVGQKLIIQSFILNYMGRELVRHSRSGWENLSTYLLSKKKRSSLFKLTTKLSIYRSSKRIYIIVHDDLKYRELIMDGNCEWYGGRIESTTLSSFKKYSDKSKVSLPLNSNYKIRQWKRRDSFILATNGHKRKVSDLFIDHKLDYIQKKTQPIITNGRGKILWIPGLAHAKTDTSDKFKKYFWKPQVC